MTTVNFIGKIVEEYVNQEKSQSITELFKDAEERTYLKGDSIVFANHDPDGVFLLLDGIVEQYDITPDGNKIVVNMFKRSSFFPMSWAINRTPNVYFYAALTDVRLKRLPAPVVVDFLHTHPEVAFDLLSRVYKGTDALLRRLTLAAGGIASSRLIFELLIEGHRFGADIGDNLKLITIKQSSLAARSGLARETVSRELHKLERGGLLTLTKQGITLDVAKLEEQLTFSV